MDTDRACDLAVALMDHMRAVYTTMGEIRCCSEEDPICGPTMHALGVVPEEEGIPGFLVFASVPADCYRPEAAGGEDYTNEGLELDGLAVVHMTRQSLQWLRDIPV